LENREGERFMRSMMFRDHTDRSVIFEDRGPDRIKVGIARLMHGSEEFLTGDLGVLEDLFVDNPISSAINLLEEVSLPTVQLAKTSVTARMIPEVMELSPPVIEF
jgi:hypothetical protein